MLKTIIWRNSLLWEKIGVKTPCEFVNYFVYILFVLLIFYMVGISCYTFYFHKFLTLKIYQVEKSGCSHLTPVRFPLKINVLIYIFNILCIYPSNVYTIFTRMYFTYTSKYIILCIIFHLLLLGTRMSIPYNHKFLH